MRSLDTITPLYEMRYCRGMLRTRLCVMLHKHQGGWVTIAASISALIVTHRLAFLSPQEHLPPRSLYL